MKTTMKKIFDALLSLLLTGVAILGYMMFPFHMLVITGILVIGKLVTIGVFLVIERIKSKSRNVVDIEEFDMNKHIEELRKHGIEPTSN